MKVSTFIIAILIASVMFVAFTTSLLEGAQQYDVQAQYIDVQKFNRTAVIDDLADDVTEDLQDTNSTFLEDTFNLFVKNTFTTARLVYNVVPAAGQMVTLSGNVLGVPAIYVTAALTLILILIGFALIRAVFKSNEL